MRHTAIKVLIVDDELAVRKLFTIALSQAGISCEAASTGKDALAVLENRSSIDAVISDLRMPGLSGMDLLAEIRGKYPDLVFLMATGVDDARAGVQALQEGADDYLVKPLEIDIVLASLERAFQRRRLQQELDGYRRQLEEMVVERTHQVHAALGRVETSYADTLDLLGTAIDLRDSPTAGHSRRVVLYSMTLAKATGGLDAQLRTLAIAAWLHDIGKLAIPDGILLKPGPLDHQERAIMQTHVTIGYELVKGKPFLAEAAEIIFAHHERCDGTGYPRGLSAEEIPVGAKIFSIVDALDAITSDRPYRSAASFQTAKISIAREIGTQFDSRVAQAFLQISSDVWERLRAESASFDILPLMVGTAGSSVGQFATP